MPEIKLTKNELRAQQSRLNQLLKYLPTLQLKKALLQIEVAEAKLEQDACFKDYHQLNESVLEFAYLFETAPLINLKDATMVKALKKRFDNIAGTEVPYFESIEFEAFEYSLIETPVWVDAAIIQLRRLKEAKVRIEIAEEKKIALEKELREVSIRVNLFEKILIPRGKRSIKKIKIFLGDQELAAVSRAKVAKRVIEEAESRAR